MKIADVMSKNVVTVRPQTPLRDVAQLLVECGYSGVPVVDEDGTLLGVVSGADVLVKERGLAAQRSGFAQLVGLDESDTAAQKYRARDAADAMTAPAVTIRPSRSVSEAAASMLEHGVNRLPVVDRDRRLVGIVTRTDLLRAFVRSDEEIQNEIEHDVVLRTARPSREEFHVVVQRGEVTLEGRVTDGDSARMLVQAIERVPGVVAVESRLAWGG